MDRRDQDMAPTTSTRAVAVIERAFVRGDGVAAARLCQSTSCKRGWGGGCAYALVEVPVCTLIYLSLGGAALGRGRQEV